MLDLDQWLDPLITIVIGESLQASAGPSMRLFRSAPDLILKGRSSLVGARTAIDPGETISDNFPDRVALPFGFKETAATAVINKLSVEKTLDKLRADDAKQS